MKHDIPEGMLPVSKILNQAIQKADLSPKMLDEIEERIRFYQAEFARIVQIQPEGAMLTIYRLMDAACEKTDKSEEKTCKKGCTFCCHINLDISEPEGRLILYWCKQHGIEINWDYLKRQQGLTMETRPLSDCSGCLFLDKDKSCKIYPVRPLACRKYYVSSPVEQCRKMLEGLTTHKVMQMVVFEAEIISSAYYGTGEEWYPYQDMLLALKDYYETVETEPLNP